MPPLSLRYAILWSLYRNDKRLIIYIIRPNNWFVKKVFYNAFILFFGPFWIIQSWYQLKTKRDPFHIIVLWIKWYEMGGCCRAQQLAIHWKKQLSLRSMEILKLFQNRVLIKGENSNITRYICIPNKMKLSFLISSLV